MNLLLLLITVVVSFIIVRAGAIAFELTGLERSIARFQSLSCFSGTGFTTREAEAIVSHPQRRMIATVLIILGNVGLVTMIATFANSLRPNVAFGALFSRIMPDSVPPAIVPWFNLAIITAALFGLYKLFAKEHVADWLRSKILSRLSKYRLAKPVTASEYNIPGAEFGTMSIHVSADHSLNGKTLKEINMADAKVSPLLLQHHNDDIIHPSEELTLSPGDVLTCFGNMSELRRIFKQR